MDFLPDSNILIRFFRQESAETEFLKEHLKAGIMYISPVVIGKIVSKASSLELEQFEQLISYWPIIPVDKEIAIVAGNYRKQIVSKTKKVYLLDCFLAATCKVHNLTLVTNDLKDYPMKDIKIIKPD